jgi:pimeloyl-ACP methyl ester carboxylesterase
MKTRHWLQLLAAAAAGVAAAKVATRYARDVHAARDRYAPLRRSVLTTIGEIEYATIGSGAPLLVVHGAGGGYDQALDLGAVLAQAGFQVIAMSRFGYLGTPLPEDASAQAQADAHVALLDALGIERAAIIGASAGAPSSLQFAIRHPARCTALVLLVPAAYVPRPGHAKPLLTPPTTDVLFSTALRFDFLFWAASKLARRPMIHGLLATPPEVLDRASPDERARANQILERILPVSSRRLGLLNDAHITSTLPRYPLEAIVAPTLVVSVADDLFGTYEAARYTAQHIPNARFVGYETGGHVWLGHHAEQADEIVSFLRRSAQGTK